VLQVPTVDQLSQFTGRPVLAYSPYAGSTLIQASLMLSTVTELTPDDFNALTSDDQALAQYGIMAMADYIYLRQPYQALLASPLMSETIGSYSYSKAEQEVARNAAALEVQGERTGVTFYDMAVQYLAKRTRAGGVYSGDIQVFERGTVKYDGAELQVRDADGQLVLFGPSDFNQLPLQFFDINAQLWPMDPGL
jgi:hypothetical protein